MNGETEKELEDYHEIVGCLIEHMGGDFKLSISRYENREKDEKHLKWR